jgi:hypothetical protein
LSLSKYLSSFSHKRDSIWTKTQKDLHHNGCSGPVHLPIHLPYPSAFSFCFLRVLALPPLHVGDSSNLSSAHFVGFWHNFLLLSFLLLTSLLPLFSPSYVIDCYRVANQLYHLNFGPILTIAGEKKAVVHLLCIIPDQWRAACTRIMHTVPAVRLTGSHNPVSPQTTALLPLTPVSVAAILELEKVRRHVFSCRHFY